MTTTAIYERIKEELASGELKEREASILTALFGHSDGLTREALVRITDGRVAYTDINSDPADRKNRRAIASLRERLIPVKSSSGEAGYRLDATVDGLREMLAEMEARQKKAEQMAEQIRQMIERCGATPIASPVRMVVGGQPTAPRPIQMTLV